MDRVKRVGVLVETDQGEQYMLYCENPGVILHMDFETETIRAYDGSKIRAVNTNCTVTLDHFIPYTVKRGHRFDSPDLPELDSPSMGSIE